MYAKVIYNLNVLPVSIYNTIGFFPRYLLHAWPMASEQDFHTGSNSCGESHIPGNSMTIVFFKRWSSLVGRPGRSRSPATVHLAIKSSPKNASLASLTAIVPTLLLHRSLGCFDITSFGETSFCVFITDEGSAFFVATEIWEMAWLAWWTQLVIGRKGVRGCSEGGGCDGGGIDEGGCDGGGHGAGDSQCSARTKCWGGCDGGGGVSAGTWLLLTNEKLSMSSKSWKNDRPGVLLAWGAFSRELSLDKISSCFLRISIWLASIVDTRSIRSWTSNSNVSESIAPI